ncbi:MAG TPA: YraN family protein [Vicinamibacterales bacterium]|nr:YraN family protein [Vicinamibacterales bacterium]
MSNDARHRLGRSGEDLACRELQRRGYSILDRRYRTRFGEIDIVARDGDVTVFVEVKTRTGDDFGGAAAGVTGWKQRRIAQMAADYLVRHGLHDRPCRFDVVAVDLAGGRPRVEVYQDAFEAPG